MNVILLGLTCWIVTLIITESEVCRPVRECMPQRFKLNYLIGCNLCTGTWVGLLLGSLYADGLINQIVYGLAIKGVAHSIYVVQKVGEKLAT